MEVKKFSFYAPAELTESMKAYIHPSETVQLTVKTIRDIAVFTDKRILIGDKQGITGTKIEYFSIPYRSIVTYAIETAGMLDLESEIKLTLNGGIGIELNFMRGKTMNSMLLNVYHIINSHMLSRN